MASSQEWFRDQFFVSTSKALIQPKVVNSALATDDVYWTNAMPEEQLKKMLANSFTFGLYELPETSSAIAGKFFSTPGVRLLRSLIVNLGRQNPAQIGLVRLITDEVTFAYLSDVFVLSQYRGKGLGKWMLECVAETLNGWPQLRRSMLLTNSEQAKQFYTDVLGMEELPQDGGVAVMTKRGPGSTMDH
ncbi:MAG: hypothetical protein M1818_003362 [Claussenomyces sp. TS43310]|nr:MAG: hypothetical protein M1818_003362 [Claussenomyces sp. TS43310]